MSYDPEPFYSFPLANTILLAEIAARLAELNENLTRINYIRIDE